VLTVCRRLQHGPPLLEPTETRLATSEAHVASIKLIPKTRKKIGYFEIYGYKPYFEGQPPTKQSEGRYIWARMTAASADEFTVSMVESDWNAKTNKDHFGRDTSYVANKQAGCELWTMVHVVDENEDTDEGKRVGALDQETRDYWTGSEIEVRAVHTIKKEDAGLLIVAALLIDELDLILP